MEALVALGVVGFMGCAAIGVIPVMLEEKKRQRLLKGIREKEINVLAARVISDGEGGYVLQARTSATKNWFSFANTDNLGNKCLEDQLKEFEALEISVALEAEYAKHRGAMLTQWYANYG